jgi:hypothetical protein
MLAIFTMAVVQKECQEKEARELTIRSESKHAYQIKSSIVVTANKGDILERRRESVS